jgi:hypothetical protein
MRILVFAFALLLARPVIAQDKPSSSIPESGVGGLGPWVPLGQAPVDQAGAGRRGYVLPGESTEVTEPGTDQVSLHAVAANNFYREQTNDFLISQRYEAHTLAVEYRHGFRLGTFPRFELGGQIQLTESDSGVLNGFISGFEGLWASMTGDSSAKNRLRTDPTTLPPLGTFVTKDGRPIYRAAGDGSGFGDVTVVAKALLRDAAPSSGDTRVAARVVVNIAGKSEFTAGNFTGIGLSLDKKVSAWAALHGDGRISLLLDRMSPLDLPLKRVSFGFSIGPELKLARNTSVNLQIDGGSTPYLPTGTAAFDKGYGDVVLGLGHRFGAGRHYLETQVYLRENMNLPFNVRWNTDPDLALGIKVTVRRRGGAGRTGS